MGKASQVENPLLIQDIHQKILAAEALVLEDLSADLTVDQVVNLQVPLIPGRDLEVRTPEQMPPRKGFSLPEGRARLLHDLANIELQAVELCLRTLIEYPAAPVEFRVQLFNVMKSEVSHLKMCVNGLPVLGFKWGDWPVHLGLWACVLPGEDLIDRILIVHRYLEGSGLDAGGNLNKRLKGVPPEHTHQIVNQITEEEVGHVKFGSDWYRRLCLERGLDPDQDFPQRFNRIEAQVPKRIDKLNRELRRRAGFTDLEMDFLDQKIESWSLF